MVHHSSLELCPGDGVRRWSLPCLVPSVLYIWSPFLEGKPGCLLRSLDRIIQVPEVTSHHHGNDMFTKNEATYLLTASL